MSNNSDDEWMDRLSESEYSCRSTGESIAYGDGVVAVSVMIATVNAQGIFAPNFAVIPEKDDLLWEPQFFSATGWEQVDEELEAADTTFVQAAHNLCSCKYCRSGIADREVFVMFTFGEIHKSHRMPNGRGLNSPTFRPMDSNPTFMCLACYLYMHKNIVEIWEEHVQQHEECEDGTLGRCWRYGCKAVLKSCDCSRASQTTGR